MTRIYTLYMHIKRGACTHTRTPADRSKTHRPGGRGFSSLPVSHVSIQHCSLTYVQTLISMYCMCCRRLEHLNLVIGVQGGSILKLRPRTTMIILTCVNETKTKDKRSYVLLSKREKVDREGQNYSMHAQKYTWMDWIQC